MPEVTVYPEVKKMHEAKVPWRGCTEVGPHLSSGEARVGGSGVMPTLGYKPRLRRAAERDLSPKYIKSTAKFQAQARGRPAGEASPVADGITSAGSRDVELKPCPRALISKT